MTSGMHFKLMANENNIHHKLISSHMTTTGMIHFSVSFVYIEENQILLEG